MHRKASVLALTAVFLLASVSAFGQSGDKAKVKGMINSRTGETFTVQTAQGNVTVVLTDSTKTKDNKGVLGARSAKAAHDVLIPGLKVDIDGTNDNRGHFVAANITIDGDDLETSQMIQAGVAPTAKQVAANTERIDALERRLAAVERAGTAAATPAPAATPTPDTTPHPDTAPPPDTTPAPAAVQAATPSPAIDSAPAVEPAPVESEAPKANVNLWVGLVLLVLVAGLIGFYALRRGT